MSACFKRTTTVCVMIILLFPLLRSQKPRNLYRLIRGGEPVQLGEIPYQVISFIFAYKYFYTLGVIRRGC